MLKIPKKAIPVIVTIAIPVVIILYTFISLWIGRFHLYGEYDVMQVTDTVVDRAYNSYDKIMLGKDFFCITSKNNIQYFYYSVYGTDTQVYVNTKPQPQSTPDIVKQMFPNAEKTYTVQGINPTDNKSQLVYTLIRDDDGYHLYDGFSIYKLVRTSNKPFKPQKLYKEDMYGKYTSKRAVTVPVKNQNRDIFVGFNVILNHNYMAIEYPYTMEVMDKSRTDFYYQIISQPTYDKLPMNEDTLSTYLRDVTVNNIPYYLGNDEPLDESKSYIIQPVDGSTSNTNDMFIYAINERLFIKLPLHYEVGDLQVELQKSM